MKKFLIILFLLFPLSISATSGCCSHHDGVCGCSGGSQLCCDGSLSPSCTCYSPPKPVYVPKPTNPSTTTTQLLDLKDKQIETLETQKGLLTSQISKLKTENSDLQKTIDSLKELRDWMIFGLLISLVFNFYLLYK